MKINEVNNNFYWLYITGFFIILALPLLNIPPWFAPPAWSQAIVFRSLLAGLFFLFLAKDKTSIQKIKEAFSPKSPIFLPFTSLLAFSLIVFISTLFSLDVSFSLWGNPDRGGGFINFFFLILFCLLGFLVIKNKDWRKLLDFSLIIGFLIGLIAIFQQFRIFSNIFVFMSSRPSSTLGNSIILALYLLPLCFLALSFFLSETVKTRKYFYLFLIIFYAFSIIFITQSRAAFLGLLVGIFWFLIAYPVRNLNSKKFNIIKISTVVFLTLILISFFLLGSNPKIYEKWPSFLQNPVSRFITLTKGAAADPVRISVWKISMQAFLEKPLLGYGPENFYIGFNKHYDPNLPTEGTKDFDRAHNFLIQILIDSGIFALVFYLILFFSLCWQLQKIKKNYPVAHGLQSGFLAYFVASLASIDSFSTFLIFFFFTAYSLYLISQNSANTDQTGVITRSEATKQFKNPVFKKTALVFIFLFLAIFLYQYNLVPFQINTNINIVKNLGTAEGWQEASKILEKEYQTKTFFSSYVNSTYIKLLTERAINQPSEMFTLSEKIAEVAKNNTELQPYNPQNWLRMGESSTILAQSKKDPEIAKKANTALKEALKLSPKDPAIFLTSFIANVSIKNFKEAEDKSVYCLKTFPETPECIWLSGLINIYLNNIEKGKDFIEKTKEKGYPIESEVSLSQLSIAYLENKNYKEMLPIYQKLINGSDSKVQYKTALALLYKYLGEYDKARVLALEIIKTNPELKPSIDEFLKTLYQ